jgi:threonine/homoserine/homoserine lactone efflux protein
MYQYIIVLLRGFIIGISIAAPVGPIGILCIRRILSEGRLAGFFCGLGAATADMIYGGVAAFGLTFIMNALIGQAHWLKLIGSIFLLYLGIKTFLSKPAEQAALVNRKGYWGAYLTTLFLTLTNPMTILSFIAIFAGVLPTRNVNSPLVLVGGVFIGSASWWLTLSLGVGLIRERLSLTLMQWINRLSGMVILLFGLYILLGNQ